MESTIGNRMRELAENTVGSVRKLGEVAGIPYRSLQNYVSDSQLPGADVLSKLANGVNANVNWLLTGKGLMFQQHTCPVNPDLFMLVGNELKTYAGSNEILLRHAKSLRQICIVYNKLLEQVPQERLGDERLIFDLVFEVVADYFTDVESDKAED